MKQIVKTTAIGLFLTICLSLSACSDKENPTAQAAPTPTIEDICRTLSRLEIQEMNETLMSWADPVLAQKLSSLELSDAYIRGLYEEFQGILVTPPDPEIYTEYSIDNGEESLARALELGKRLHNHFFAFPEEEIERYGPLIAAMRNVLLVDVRHIPLAIKRDASRDVYWHGLHYEWLKDVELEYSGLYGD